MKKSILTLVFIFSIYQIANAQAYQKGQKLLNANVAIGAYSIDAVSSFLSEKITSTHNKIGLGASFEVGVTEQISAGGFFGFSSQSELETRFLHFGARGSYHLTELLKLNNDQLDLYAGAGLGYRVFSGNGLSSEDTQGLSKIFIPIHVGGRYYFKDNLAGFAELGTGFSIFQAGVTVKF